MAAILTANLKRSDITGGRRSEVMEGRSDVTEGRRNDVTGVREGTGMTSSSSCLSAA